MSLPVPARLLDTRPGTTTVDGQAVGGGVVLAGTVRDVKVGTRAGIPLDAAAVAINVTAIEATGISYATVYACDQAIPVASNLNFVAGQTVPNLVVTRMSADGTVCIHAGPAGGAHFIVDAAGYFPAGTNFVGLPVPARLLDTRPGATTVDGHAAGAGAVAAGTVKEVKVGTRAGIPVDAPAVVINVTAIEATGTSFATVYACGQPTPVASNLNFVAGQTVPNLVVTRMSAEGKVCIYAGPGGGAHFVVDAIAYLSTGTDFIGFAVPARMLDTRPGAATIDGHAQGSGIVAADWFKEFKVAGRVGIPRGSTVIFNVTVVDAAGASYATVYPCDQPIPVASNLNFVAGQTVANLVITRVDSKGKVCIYLGPGGGAHLLADAIGYFPGTDTAPPTHQ